MKPFAASILNAIILIGMGLWGYFGSDAPSLTALIPVGIGVVIIAMSPGFRNGNRVIAHIVVILTVLTLVALVKPLAGSFQRNDNAALIRVLIMMLFTLYALILYIRSFVNARKNRS